MAIPKKKGIVRMPRRQAPTPTPTPEVEEVEAAPPFKAIPEAEEVEAEVVEEVPEPPKKKVRARKAPAPAPAPKQELVVREDAQLAVPSGDRPGMSGDFDSDDMDTPGFKLLHPLSPDASDTPDMVGSFVWNKEVNLGKDIEVVIAHVRKEFQEDCEYDPSSPPQIFAKREHAAKVGVAVKPRAIVDLLIPCTEENVDEALIELDEVPFLMARWYVQGAAYRKFMSPFCTHQLKTNERPWHRYYNLTASEVKASKGRMFITSLTPTDEETTEGIRASCASR